MFDEEEFTKNMQQLEENVGDALDELFEAVHACEDQYDYEFVMHNVKLVSDGVADILRSLQKLYTYAENRKVKLDREFANSVLETFKNIPTFANLHPTEERNIHAANRNIHPNSR